jgi:predicted transcriptional regulator
MNVEDVFSSKTRMKVLKILVQIGELNVSEIARRLKVNYLSASKHLKILEDEGVVLHKMFGRICLYRLNEHSPKARAVQNLIDAWEHADTGKPHPSVERGAT